MWLLGNELEASGKGPKTILYMAQAVSESIEALYLIFKQQGPGCGEYVVVTVEHYILFASMARNELIGYACRYKRKQNVNASSFRR